MRLFLIAVLLLSNAFGKNLVSDHTVNTEINNRDINEEKELVIEISDSAIHSFTILNANYFYCFSSDTENVFYKSEDEKYVLVPNESFFGNGDIIYINPEGKTHSKIIIKINPYPIYKELNSFQTVNDNQYFFIRAGEESIAYFDSFDRNSYAYISETFDKTILKNDIKINGKFYTVNKDKVYMIKNRIYSNYSISNFKQYFYPAVLSTKEINIKDNEINYIYLKKDGTYKLNFQQSSMKKMIKLSTKTPNAKVTTSKEGAKELNQENPYLELDNFSGELQLTVKDDNAFIEFLYNIGEADILTEENKEDYISSKNTIIIKIPKTQKDFGLLLEANKDIKFSLSFGLSKSNYYYSSSNNNLIDAKSKSITLIYSPFKYLEPLKDEFLSLAINFEENHEIKISYTQFSDIDELLDEKMDKKMCEDIKTNLAKVLDIYVFSDIAQNPPNIEDHPGYHHKKINLKKEIQNIETENRKYYEFIQEVETILTTTKDLHFNIEPYSTKNGSQIYYYQVFLPFSFAIRKDENNEQRIFIVKNQYMDYYDNETKQFINSHLNIPLKSINDIEVFDYIQNWSQYRSCKNSHAQFTYAIQRIPRFYLSTYPVNYYDLKNDFEFDDNKIIKISYGIIKPNPKLQTAEFNDYFMEIRKKKYTSPIVPDIDEIKESFLISKGLKTKLKTENPEAVEWNITLDESGYVFKCRVDEVKKVNVILQNTFHLDLTKFIGTVLECTKLFHSNSYPVIVIETLNGGGYAYMPLILHQVLNMRTTNRCYNSYRLTDVSTKYLQNNYGFYFTNMETCELVDSYKKIGQTLDFYNYNDLNITHNRTQVMDFLFTSFRKALDQFRKDYENSTNLKKPTDIIIFTDAFSYSATSGFIKSIQKTGAGIIVGYYGNPKNKGTFDFDGSQSFSSVVNLDGTDMYTNLNKLGFIINGVTVSETFDDFYQEGSSIPLEYHFDAVDERVEIYSRYSDDLYNTFIDEGLQIHEKYKKNCNPNNEKLLLHDNNCKTVNNLDKAHGGYKCKEDGTWSTECEPYYCDIGYYYDRYKGQCIKECDIANSKNLLLFEKDFSDEIQIKKNEIYYYFPSSKDDIYYIFEASDDLIDYYPRISAIDFFDEIIVNKNKKSSGTLNIYTIKKDPNIFYNTRGGTISDEYIGLFDYKYVMIYKPNQDHIFYLKGISNRKSGRIKYAKLDKPATFKDIENLNSTYFNEFYDELAILNKSQTYALSFDFDNKTIEQLYFYIQRINYNKVISINSGAQSYLYLKQNTSYILSIKDKIMSKVLKLSRLTKNSEIYIKEKNITLNSNNLYCKIEGNYTGDLNLTVNNSDAFIEILYYSPKIITLDFEKKEFSNLTEGMYLVSIPKNISCKFITFEIKGKENVMYSIVTGYSIPESVYYKDIPEGEEILKTNFAFDIDNPYENKIELLDEEQFNLLFYVFNEELALSIKIDGKSNDEKKNDKKGLKTWALVLIIGGSILLLILIILIIIHFKRRKQFSNKEIEEKMENLTPIGES